MTRGDLGFVVLSMVAAALGCGGGGSAPAVSALGPADTADAAAVDGDAGAPPADAGAGVADAAPPLDAATLAALMPQVVDQGGPVLAHPRVVVITFPGEDDVPIVENMASALGASAYWKAATAEYGVGP